MRDPAGDPERRNPRASRATRGPKLSGSNSGDISRESSSSDTTPNDGDTQQSQRYRYWQDNVCYKHLKEEIREIGDTGDSIFPEDQHMLISADKEYDGTWYNTRHIRLPT